MLREITLQELADLIGQDVKIHILIEDESEELEETDEEQEEEPEEPDEDEDPDGPQMKKRQRIRNYSDTEQKVLAAWNGGERTIKEIMEMTGLSYPTVRKYIPVSVNG